MRGRRHCVGNVVLVAHYEDAAVLWLDDYASALASARVTLIAVHVVV